MNFTRKDLYIKYNKYAVAFFKALRKVDFYKIERYMKKVNLEWYDVGGVPTIDDMLETVEDLALDVLPQNPNVTKYKYNVASGGFEVILKVKNSKPKFKIKFHEL